MMRFARNGEGLLEEWMDGPYIHASVRLPKATCSDPIKDGIAWRLWELCLSLFTTLRPLIIDSTPNIDASSIAHWKDLLGTLFVWGDGFRNGQLDLALQDSDDLKHITLTDLVAIAVILKTRLYRHARFARDEQRADALLQIQELDGLLEKARSTYKDGFIIFEEDFSADSAFSPTLTIPSGHVDGDIDLSNLKSHKEICGEELSYIAKELGNHVFSLMALVPSIENALAQIKDKITAPSAPQADFTVSEPAWLYVSNVRDKFPKANRKLIERLGQANWERHTKITERLDEHADVYSKVTQGIDGAKSIFSPSSLFHDSALGSSLHAIHCNKVVSRPSSSASHPRGSGRLRVPPTPSEVEKCIPFTCNICGHLLHKIKNRNDWKVHVFADLHPYMCTFPSCRDQLVTFPTRRSWADHEFSYHRVDKYWNCPRCLEEMPSISSWSEHLAHEHDITYTGSAYQDAIETAENTIPQPYETQQCPLCLVVPGHTQKGFINHVGKHLEEIALAALPRKPVSTSETDSMSSTHTPNAESHALKGGGNEFVPSLVSTPSPKMAHCRLDYSKPLEEPETRAFSPLDQRQEKCPLETCAKTFDRKFDKNRHTLTHFKGTLVCRFCPQLGSAGLQQFTRVDTFKKHLTERHGAGGGRNVSLQRRNRGKATVASVICAVCHQTFNDAHTLYRHLDECILRLIKRRDAGQSKRQSVSRSQPFVKGAVHDSGQISGIGDLSSTVYLETSSRKSLKCSRLWSHDIPLGVDGLYHCPWENEIHCSHSPVSLRHELHKHIDEHRKPYRCTNRLCGDVRFSSEAGLRRHELKSQHLHMATYEYKTYICPYVSCAETPAGGIFRKTSELRQHITQQHNNKGLHLLYWSDSSSSSQSPPPTDTLDISYGDNSWDEWFKKALEQIDYQPASGLDHDYVQFPTTNFAQDECQNTITPNEELSLTQQISSFPSFDFKSNEPEVFNAQNFKPPATNIPSEPTHGSLLGTFKENRMSHASNLNFSEPLDHLNYNFMLPIQPSLPASTTFSMATDPVLDPMQSLVMTERTLPMTQLRDTDLLSTSPISTLGTHPGPTIHNTSPLVVPSNHQQPVKRLRSLVISTSKSGTIGSAHGIHGHVELPRKARTKVPVQGKLASERKTAQEDRISMAVDIYGVSDTENDAPKKRRKGRLQGSRTLSENQSVPESFFDLEPSQEASIEPLSPSDPRETPGFQCPTCRRTYKTEEKLSHHLQNHRHKYHCKHFGCYLTFDPIKDFNRHVETHAGQRERVYCNFMDCEYATKGFSRKDNLTRHVRLHHEPDDEPGEEGMIWD